MKKSSIVALAAVFIIGAGSAVGFQVHAQSATTSAPQPTAQVQTTAQDPQNTDGEIADDATVSATEKAEVKDTADTAESGTETPDASDANETDK